MGAIFELACRKAKMDRMNMIYDNKLEVKEMVGCILVREDIWWPWPVELPLASLVQISHYPFMDMISSKIAVSFAILLLSPAR